MKPNLTIPKLIKEAKIFCSQESTNHNTDLFGITDGKAIGTHIEHKFKKHLSDKYNIAIGSSANGIDLPSDDIQTDIKVTSIVQPQSSCPFRDAKQKIFGLGYNLLLFVYDKKDNHINKTANLDFLSCSFVSKERTADYTITYRLNEMIKDGGNLDDISAYLADRNIPADSITLRELAEQILTNPPMQGYLTISNALQWRLQYKRIVDLSQSVDGITKIISKVNK